MDNNEEYHDPDYQGTSTCIKNEPQTVSDEGKIEKIKNIIKCEFSNELEVRENEIMLIEQRLSSSRKMLHRLRYTIVDNYYGEQKLHLTAGQIDDEISAQGDPKSRSEAAAILREGQKRLHPSVRKLLGKTTVDLDEIFKTREPRNKERKNYSAMVKRNYTIAADATTSLRPLKSELDSPAEPEPPRPLAPSNVQPAPSNVLTLDEGTRNRTKHRYRIIIGNTSKYAPGASRADRSTHKWLLYVREASDGGAGAGATGAGAAGLLTAVTVRLHHSYHPHHIVHIDKPPFHVSRRGWGEFPAKVELHFALPERNRPATVEHMIKLDRNYTGLQTLGSETIVDVWLYSTPEMLPFEFKEDSEVILNLQPLPQIKMEVPDNDITEEENQEEMMMDSVSEKQDSWLDFFTKESTLDVDEMIIKPQKSNIADLDDSLIGNNHAPHIKQEPDLELTNFTLNGPIKTEPDWSLNYNTIENPSEHIPNDILCPSTSPKKKIMKYMDPTTGKIYYLEMDRDLDLSKVQEIIINSKGNVQTAKISPTKPATNGLKSVRKPSKKGVSLLKPEVQNLLKNETAKPEVQIPVKKINNSFIHLENDHCYLGPNWSFNTQTQNSVLPCERTIETNSVASVRNVKKEPSLYNKLQSVISRLTSVRIAVSYLLKNIPVICDSARDPDFVKNFPFVVESEERYWKLDFAKRRNIEWSRAKMINTLLHSNFTHIEPIWRTKQILIYSRLHGYYPLRPEALQLNEENHTDWSNWSEKEHDSKQSLAKFSTLSTFKKEDFEKDISEIIDCDSDEELEIVGDSPVRVKLERDSESSSELELLPVPSEEDHLRFMFIERTCADIGIELRNEDIGSGYSYSAVHAVLLSALRSFAEDLIRNSLAVSLSTDQAMPNVWVGSSSRVAHIGLEATSEAVRNKLVSSRDLARTQLARDKLEHV